MHPESNPVVSFISSKPLVIGLACAALILVAYYFLVIFEPPQRFDAAQQSHEQELSRKANDAALISRVRAAINMSKRLSSFEIGVEIRNGIVTLTGEVPTPTEKELAESLVAAAVNGAPVSNQLQINLSAAPHGDEAQPLEAARLADFELRADVRTRLMNRPELQPQQIEVAVLNGTVILSGRISSERLRALAERTAREVPGVKNVTNQLAVTDAR